MALTDNLVLGYDPVGQGSGSSLTDQTGNGRDAAFNATPTFDANGLTFVASDSDRASVTVPISDDMSFHFRVHLDTLKSLQWVFGLYTSDPNDLSFWHNNSSSTWNYGSWSGVAARQASSTGYTAGTWINVCITHSRATDTTADAALYINGTLADTGTSNFNFLSPPTGLVLGTRSAALSTSLALDGTIASFVMWSRILTSGEIGDLNTDHLAWLSSGGITGSGAQTISVTTSGTGSVAVNGSGAQTVAVTTSGTGAVAVTGDGAQTVSVGQSAAGSVAVDGQGAQTVDVTVSGSGTVVSGISGAGAQTVDVTTSGTGAVAVSGDGAQTVGVTTSGTGAVAISGDGAQTVDVTSGGTGVVNPTITGAGSQTILVTSGGTGAVLITGDGAQTIEVTTKGYQTPPSPYTRIMRIPAAGTFAPDRFNRIVAEGDAMTLKQVFTGYDVVLEYTVTSAETLSGSSVAAKAELGATVVDGSVTVVDLSKKRFDITFSGLTAGDWLVQIVTRKDGVEQHALSDTLPVTKNLF